MRLERTIDRTQLLRDRTKGFAALVAKSKNTKGKAGKNA
jgi:hypothetical protein